MWSHKRGDQVEVQGGDASRQTSKADCEPPQGQGQSHCVQPVRSHAHVPFTIALLEVQDLNMLLAVPAAHLSARVMSPALAAVSTRNRVRYMAMTQSCVAQRGMTLRNLVGCSNSCAAPGRNDPLQHVVAGDGGSAAAGCYCSSSCGLAGAGAWVQLLPCVGPDRLSILRCSKDTSARIPAHWQHCTTTHGAVCVQHIERRLTYVHAHAHA